MRFGGQVGRITLQSEYNTAGTSVVYSKSANYDADSDTTSDTITTVRSGGAGTFVEGDTYQYGAYQSGSGTSSVYGGAYQGGNVTFEVSTLTKNGNAQPTTLTQNSYIWSTGAVESQITYTPNAAAPGTTYTTGYQYAPTGFLALVDINDGTPRTIAYDTNFSGEVLSSDNTKGPQSRYYFFDGIQEAQIDNSGTGNLTYSQSLVEQTATPGSGYYQNGSTTPTQAASFGTQMEQIDGFGNQSATTPDSYTVQSGDTLQSIAQAVWGDSNFWYLIADANGLTGDPSLTPGEVLSIPTNVVANQNNASTNTVYNANQAIGNNVPDHAPPPKHNSGCGAIGEILEVIVAIVVSAVTVGFGSPFAAAAVAAVTDAAEQGIGLATGLQSKFNWVELGEAALSAGLGAELGPASSANPGGLDIFGDVGSAVSDVLGPDVGFGVDIGLTDATANALTQGVFVAAGLQKKFDWAGVAEAGIAAGVTAGVGSALGLGAQGNTFGQNLEYGTVAGAAGVIAGAAARTLINGSDFGDNIIRALPSVGQAIGNVIGGQIVNDNSTAQAQNTPQPSGNGGQNDFGEVQIASNDSTFVPTPPQQSGGFWNTWVGEGVTWVDNNIVNPVVQAGENAINDASTAIGLGPIIPEVESGVETITVTASKWMNDFLAGWSARPLAPSNHNSVLDNSAPYTPVYSEFMHRWGAANALIEDGRSLLGQQSIFNSDAQNAGLGARAYFDGAVGGLQRLSAMALPLFDATVGAVFENSYHSRYDYTDAIANTASIAAPMSAITDGMEVPQVVLNNNVGNSFTNYVQATKLAGLDRAGQLLTQEQLPTPDLAGQSWVQPDFTILAPDLTYAAFADAKAGEIAFDDQARGFILWAAETNSKTFIYYTPDGTTVIPTSLLDYAEERGVTIRQIGAH